MSRAAETEIETKLVVVSERPDEILERIAGTGELAGFSLVAMTEQSIRDVYYDTPAQLLRAADLALRVRQVNWTLTLGLKGRSRRLGAAIERLEIERPWSAAGLAEVLAALARLGVVVGAGAPGEPVDEPEAALRALGLAPFQERLTQRARREIADRERAHLGELALDRAVFAFGRERVRHYEIEIEAPGAQALDGTAALATALLTAWPGELRPWEHSKVATGRAIEHLVATRPPALLLNRAGAPTAAAYDAMDRWLRGR